MSKGDIVFFQPYAMGRMEYLWGKDAEIFRPERWLDDEGIFQSESPYKFVAFQVSKSISFFYEIISIFFFFLFLGILGWSKNLFGERICLQTNEDIRSSSSILLSVQAS